MSASISLAPDQDSAAVPYVEPEATGNSFTGEGYFYVVVPLEHGGKLVQLNCTREFLDYFEASVGAINSVNMPNLRITQVDTTWWEVVGNRDEGVAMRFISRLNRWSLKKAAERELATAKADTQSSSVQVKRHYSITVDQPLASSQRLNQPLASSQRLNQPLASSQRLNQLAKRFARR